MGQDLLQALTILGALMPFVVILAMANLSLRMPGLRWLAYGMVFVLSGGFLLMGAGGLAATQVKWAPGYMLGPGLEVTPNWLSLGIWGMITGVGALLALTRPVRALAGRMLPAFDPDNPLHAISLSFAAFLVGLTAIQLALLGDLEHLADRDIRLGFAEIWAQGIGLTLVGLVGVGLWTRRNLREVAQRLGVTKVTGKVLLVSAVSIAAFMGLDLAWTGAWERLDPQGLDVVSRVSKMLFGDLINLPGALSIGITAAISEEIIYRGALQPRFGLMLTAALFAVSHVQYGLSPAAVEVFIIGLALGVIRRRYGLTACMLIHFGYNTLNLLLLPPR
ncbi:MAG TPA: CPBP family intramembrane metalloprotease [Caldilineae bacterium]|nr:CPBP family intramembrane metalloprotease [Caldilineae bacterium]